MWFDCTKAALKKLNIAYNSLRRFMFLPWRSNATEMFVNLWILSFDEMLRIFLFSFRSRVTASHNQLICSLCSAHCSVYSKLWAWWNSLFHILVNAIFYLYAPGLCKYIFYSFCIYLINCIVMNYVYTLF